MNDEALVAAASQEPALFGEIIERYEAPLCRYISRLGVRVKEDQEDVLQEIFIKIYRNLNGFDTAMKFSSWAYRIAHNEAISWFRKRNVRPEGHLVIENEIILDLAQAPETSQEALFDEGVNADVVAQALESIDKKYRQVLILRFFEHQEYDAISDILQIPIGSVGTLIHRGKQQLKKRIDIEKIRV